MRTGLSRIWDGGARDELGWFEHGSTIIVFAPRGLRLCDGLAEGTTQRMGQRLMVLP